MERKGQQRCDNHPTQERLDGFSAAAGRSVSIGPQTERKGGVQ